MFAKMLNAILFARQNALYAVIYVVTCFLHLAFLPEPVYRGPEFITYFRGPHLENEIARDTRITWIVEFYAAWAPPCTVFAPIFSELSAKYNLDNLKFGKIDVTRYPDVAKKYFIDTSSWSNQLPTLILFQDGKESRRRPACDSKGRLLAKFVFNKDEPANPIPLARAHSPGLGRLQVIRFWIPPEGTVRPTLRYQPQVLPGPRPQENVIRDFELTELYTQCKQILAKRRSKKETAVDKSDQVKDVSVSSNEPGVDATVRQRGITKPTTPEEHKAEENSSNVIPETENSVDSKQKAA